MWWVGVERADGRSEVVSTDAKGGEGEKCGKSPCLSFVSTQLVVTHHI